MSVSPGAAVAGAALPRPVPPPPRLTCVEENTVRQIKSKLIHMSEKLATLIGIQVVGLHQGQRKYAPRKQAGHMTAVDQIVRNVEKVLARGGRPHMTLRTMANGRKVSQRQA